MKSWFAIGILLVLISFVVYDFIKPEKDNDVETALNETPTTKDLEEIETGLKKGELAPDFKLTNIQGKPISLSDFRGKKVILNFWASWCGPCIKEMPEMQKFYEAYQDKGVEVVAVNLTMSERNRKDVDEFVEEFALSFPIPMDEKGEQEKIYQIITIPTSYFLDEEGVVQQIRIGPMTEEFMEKSIADM